MKSPLTVFPLSTPGDLLLALRRYRLLAPSVLRRLTQEWAEDTQGEKQLKRRLRELVRCRILTHYQARHLRAGKGRHLRLGPYRLLDRLAGGSGKVYQAEHILLLRKVALKIIARVPQKTQTPQSRRTQLANDTRATSRSSTPARPEAQAEEMRRFRREVAVTARLHHPNLVMAHDAGRGRGVLFLVTEFVEGMNLEQWVRHNGPLPPTLAGEVVWQVALALDYLHGQGFVHHDIKPANLILTSSADSSERSNHPIVKLLDLGLARSLNDERKVPLDGTPDYLAPERGQGMPRPDVRSDLYSLGCTLYFLLTGQVPYPGGNWTSKLLRHYTEKPIPVRQLRPEVPVVLAQVVEHLMAQDIEQRPASAAVVADTLEKILDAAEDAPDQPQEMAPHPRAVAPVRSHPQGTPQAAEQTRAELPHQAPQETRWMSMGSSMTVLAIVTGVLVAGGIHLAGLPQQEKGKQTEKEPTRLTSAAAGTDAFRFTVVTGSRKQSFTTLAEAILAAKDGDTVVIAGRGVMSLPPLRWQGKALTLRAAPGSQPCLQRIVTGERRHSHWWQALLTSDRSLTLEGLELRGAEGTYALVSVEGGSLHLKKCHLHGFGNSPAVVLRQGSRLQVESCVVESNAVGFSVEVGDPKECQLNFVENTLHVHNKEGVLLSLWSSEGSIPCDCSMRFEGNTCETGRLLALRSLPRQVQITARKNKFKAQCLVSCKGYAEMNWRSAFAWKGEGNKCQIAGSRVRMNGKRIAVPQEVWTTRAKE